MCYINQQKLTLILRPAVKLILFSYSVKANTHFEKLIGPRVKQNERFFFYFLFILFIYSFRIYPREGLELRSKLHLPRSVPACESIYYVHIETHPCHRKHVTGSQRLSFTNRNPFIGLWSLEDVTPTLKYWNSTETY